MSEGFRLHYRRGMMWANSHPYGVYALTLLVIYVGLALSRITLGNLALSYSAAGVPGGGTIGVPRYIRSDEFLRAVPGIVGGLAPGYSLADESPLDAVSLLPELGLPGPLQSMLDSGSALGLWFIQPVFLEWPVARLLGPEVGFTFLWWLPVMATLLLMPLFLSLLGVRKAWGVAAAALTVLTAPVMWWSFLPLWVLSSALAAGTSVLLVGRLVADGPVRGGRLVGVIALSCVGVVALARLPFMYQPWSFSAGVVVASVVTGSVLADRQRRRRLAIAIGAIVLPAMVLVSLLLLETRPVWEALTSTVYPGTRRSTGGIGADAGLAWFGGLAWKLQVLEADEMLKGLPSESTLPSNQSEMSLGFLVYLPALAIVAATLRRRSMRESLPAIIGLASAGILLGWGVVDWPSIGVPNPLSLVAPARSLQFLGVMVPMLVVLVLTAVHRGSPRAWVRRAALVGGATIMILTLMSASQANATRLPIAPWEAWMSAGVLAAAFVSVFVVRGPGLRFVPYFLVSAVTVAVVNPVQVGLRGLVDSDLVTTIQQLDAVHGGRWATDSVWTDAAVIAAGVPRVTGQQYFGPNRRNWLVLDPSGEREEVWNRGASFIRMAWVPEGQPTEFISDSADQILVRIDPCSPALAALGTAWVISHDQLSGSCLTQRAETEWRGMDVYVYSIRPAVASSQPGSQ